MSRILYAVCCECTMAIRTGMIAHVREKHPDIHHVYFTAYKIIDKHLYKKTCSVLEAQILVTTQWKAHEE